ncbi:MAG: AAA family ATPase [Candidatus Thorarchaeota archaeon]
MNLVIITGMPGAGKGVLADAFREAGIPVIVMGDVIRTETQQRGLEPNPTNTKKVMLELREIDGPGAVALRCVQELRTVLSPTIVIEGCRSIAEIDVFDDYAKRTTIIGVHASPSLRFQRLKDRARKDAPPEWNVFRERDIREISVGLGGVIALSDIMIINESSIEEMQVKSKEIVERFL